jgi:hypothetical protein
MHSVHAPQHDGTRLRTRQRRSSSSNRRGMNVVSLKTHVMNGVVRDHKCWVCSRVTRYAEQARVWEAMRFYLSPPQICPNAFLSREPKLSRHRHSSICTDVQQLRELPVTPAYVEKELCKLRAPNVGLNIGDLVILLKRCKPLQLWARSDHGGNRSSNPFRAGESPSLLREAYADRWLTPEEPHIPAHRFRI